MPRGPKPKPGPERPGSSKRVHQWKPAPGVGWQHGKIPATPQGLMPKSRKAWRMWFEGWWAAFWNPEDVPQLELCIGLFDQVVRGDTSAMTKLQPMLDRYGITPKGQQDLRWAPPAAEPEVDDDAADELEERRAKRRQKLA